ncbi:MAG TPA: lysine--tRNA ligase [Candidatus Babeliales bacterium]|nr:lysine--tRNA ligase [Candidatus Babeliales bacterium]
MDNQIKKNNVIDEPRNEHDISNEHAIRLEKIKTMRAQGLEPWPAGKEVTATCKDVIDEFDHQAEKKQYAIAGRILAFREHGKTAFANIQDQTGRLQIYLRQDELGAETFEQLKHLVDIGDIIWVSGVSFRTKMGEITLKASSYALLSKCLHPLPEKFHGLADIETIYRQRYLDLISNQESKSRFIARSKVIRTLRNLFDTNGYLEVETPMLHPIPGGAAAKPFTTHHNALDTTLYLRIAPELYLKRLVVGGLERVYEINRNFRNEGISTRHNPEFTMVEFYTAYKDYHYAMDFTEQLIRAAAMESNGKLQLPFGDREIDFQSPFLRLSMRDAVKQYGNISDADLSDAQIDATLKKHGIVLPVPVQHASWGQKLYGLFETLVESKLIQPTFIIQFPIEVSPLSKRDETDKNMAARFELFIGGMEISNGFNELNDPFDQADRFKQQVESREAGDAEAHHYDADYVHALEYGLPPTAGVGIGIDRLVMLLTNTTSIKDVILFPTLKQRHE